MNRISRLILHNVPFWALCCMMLAALVLSVSSMGHPHLLGMTQERATMGGTACGVAAGISFGLGIASLFGCVACGVGSLLIGGVTYFVC